MSAALVSRLGSVPSCSFSVTRSLSSRRPPPSHCAFPSFCAPKPLPRTIFGELQPLLRMPQTKSLAPLIGWKSATPDAPAQPMKSGKGTQQMGRVSAITESFLNHSSAQKASILSAPAPLVQIPSKSVSKKPQKLFTNSHELQQVMNISTTAPPSFPATLPPPRQKKKTAKDSRQTLIDSCPLTPVDELVVAAHMARLSNICYVPEPQEQLENLGLKLIAQGKTYFTAWYIADGPDLSQVQEQAPLAGIEPQGREGGVQDSVSKSGVSGGIPKRRIRYVLTHGVRWGAADLDSGRMWRQIMNCFPVDFPPKGTAHEAGAQQSSNPRPQEGLVAHRGVLEIAEEVYAGVRPWLRGVETGEVSAIRFGGHSLGGSVAVLLMLLAKARHGLEGGQVSAHLFGSPAVLARWSAVRKQGSKEEKIKPSSKIGIPLPLSENSATSMSSSPGNHQSWSRTWEDDISELETNTGTFRESPSCPVLDVIGLPADAVRSIVLDKDMVPRMFLAADPSYGLLLKSPLVRGLLEWRERVWGPGVLTQERFLFENVGLVHYIKTVGSEVLVRTLTSEQANEGLRLNMDDFVRQPMNVIKALFDHHRGHYSQDLEAAAAAAKYRSKMEKVHQSY